MSDLTHAINGFVKAMELEGEAGRGYGSVSISVDRFLRSCLTGELKLRRLFARDPANIIVQNPYEGLFDIFDLCHKATLARPRPWNEQGQFDLHHDGQNYPFPQSYILPVAPRLRRDPGTPCIVNDLSVFNTAWDIFSGRALSAIRTWDNIIVAGGSVLACLLSFQTNPSQEQMFDLYQSSVYRNSDIDLFLWGLDEDKAKDKMQEIFEAVSSASSVLGVVCIRTKSTITIQAEYPKRPIQIIMRLYRSPAEILCGFDVDCCCFAYNGTNVFTNLRGLTSIVRQCNTIDLTRRSPSDEINYLRLSKRHRTVFPKGLGQLIVYEIMDMDYKQFEELYSDSSELRVNSPVPVESLRPSNYDYTWVKIPYGEEWWDVRKVQKAVEAKEEEIIAVQDRCIHQHVLTCGTMAECLERCCATMPVRFAGNRQIGERNGEDLVNGFFRGPAEFIVDDPGRQTAGSFNPIGNDDAPDYDLWELDAYRDDSDTESDASQ